MNMDLLEKSAEAVAARWPDAKPVGGMILGSGWSGAVEACEILDTMSYAEIPGLGEPGVVGHAGRLARARCAAGELFVFQGRRHYYEGLGWTPIAAPVAILKHAGARMLLLTNAAGGIAEGFRPGDLMIVRDHINLMGASPLVGPHHPGWGPRFPDMTRVYGPRLRKALHAAAQTAGLSVLEGVYLAVSGPAYETPSEVHAYGRLGADAVGMSTVPEAVLAHAAGIEVAGLTCITNAAAGLGSGDLDHAEVTTVAEDAMSNIRALVAAFWQKAFAKGEGGRT
ncbi:MAG: purine-nucleoside phosphorylase [Lentisphaerae bacterium]|nr:purine-nucleoside phosphorylase [Lentisphaerota bacterium]